MKKKFILVGNYPCGKTSLLDVYLNGTVCAEYYSPPSMEIYEHVFSADEFEVHLMIMDTPSQAEYDHLRPLHYPDTDVVLFCFAIDDKDSFHSIKQRWFSEIEHHCPCAARILVGNKVDVRNTCVDTTGSIHKLKKQSHEFIFPDEGHTLAKDIGACAYVECSARTKEGIEEVFMAAVRATTKLSKGHKHNNVRKKGPRCWLM